MGSKSDQADIGLIRDDQEQSVETAKRIAQSALGVDISALRHLNGELLELGAVIAADYASLPALPSRAGSRALAGMVEGEFPPLCEWKQREGARFRVRHPAACCQEIAVRAAPYTAGAGLGLWGFSCATRKEGQGTFVIYLNTAHLPGAIAVTAAHELGHYFEHSLRPSAGHIGFAPMAANFAAHLSDRAELFSDSAAALASYGAEAACRMTRARNRPLLERSTLAQELVHPAYRIDFASPKMSVRWRLRYLTACAHFMKLRIALAETSGV